MSLGGNLILRIASENRAKWAFRWTLNGRVREHGLGAVRAGAKGTLDGVSLSDARDAASKCRAAVEAGDDPIELANAPEPAPPAVHTFRMGLEAVLEDRVADLKSPKYRIQWRTTVETYAAALLDEDIRDIDTEAVLKVLRPIWSRIPDAANRVRARIEIVLATAIAKGWRSAPNPAAWRGHLSNMLVSPRKVAEPEHHSALPWQQAPGFVAELRARRGMPARCLEFVVLTATRSNEARGARWHEVDFENAIWSIPGGRTKTAKPLRVPLSDAAVALLKAVKSEHAGPMDYCFKGDRPGKPVHSNAMMMALLRMNPRETEAEDAPRCWRDADGRAVTIHGWRSVFRDWVSDATVFPDRLAEIALGHALPKVEGSYSRSDRLEQRRPMMEAWATFLSGKRAQVVTLKPRKARA